MSNLLMRADTESQEKTLSTSIDYGYPASPQLVSCLSNQCVIDYSSANASTAEMYLFTIRIAARRI